jgi:hypothetical protein
MELRVEVPNGTPLAPDSRYRYEPELGPVAVDDDARGGLLVHGRALLALASGELDDARDLRELKPTASTGEPGTVPRLAHRRFACLGRGRLSIIPPPC